MLEAGVPAGEGLPHPDRRRPRPFPAARAGRSRRLPAVRSACPRRRSSSAPSSKDGVGWGDGAEPKLIKGPDVLLAAVERLREVVPELAVLLTGPARGYVAAGLERLGVPFRHVLLPDLDAVADAYRALDVCLVASRDEGGPKAVLESMATGVPIVTTRVGQAADLVRHGENGFLVDVEDAEGHRGRCGRGCLRGGGPGWRASSKRAGETAEACSYEALEPRWRELLHGFVEGA